MICLQRALIAVTQLARLAWVDLRGSVYCVENRYEIGSLDYRSSMHASILFAILRLTQKCLNRCNVGLELLTTKIMPGTGYLLALETRVERQDLIHNFLLNNAVAGFIGV